METVISTNQKIINTLLLNASFIDNIGLMHGKMGISIFFFHLAKQTRNKIYEDYAGELIDEIYEEITLNTPVDFENGLAGIGWGIEYLAQNGFIEADTDEVLDEFDKKIFKELIYNTPQEIGISKGLTGLGAYFLKRVQNSAFNEEKIPTLTNKQCLIHLIDELERRTKDISEIISEPFKITNHESQTIKNKTFDITWDYPVLLWFLSELYNQKILNFKIEKIIQQLIEPLSDYSNYPELLSNKLLLALALTKLQQVKYIQPQTKNNEQQTTNEKQPLNSRTFESSDFETIISNLLTGKNRNIIKSELPADNDTIRYGTSGIARVYRQLHRLTGDNHLKKEMEYWLNSFFVSDNIDEDDLGKDFENLKAFGLLEGLAGTLHISETSENLNKKSTT